jgi:sulfofructose kinase
MARVFLTGLAVVDFVFMVEAMPIRAEKYRAETAAIVGGGCAANAAVTIARLGGRATLASRLGDDLVGDLIIADLEKEGVRTDFIHRAKGGRSAFSSVYVDPAAERQVMNFRGEQLTQETHWLERAPEADAMLVDTRWQAGAETVLRMARRRDVPGVVDAEDPVDLMAIEQASHVAFSKQGLLALTGEETIAAALAASGKRLSGWVCVTDGAAGAYFLDGANVEHVPGFNVAAKDTLAAGDVWHGAFALRLAEGADEISAMVFANATAALKCTRAGGRAGCPDRSNTELFLKEKTSCN